MISFIGGRQRAGSVFGLLDLTPLNKAQKEHMTKVYVTLSFMSLLNYFSVILEGPWNRLNAFIIIPILIASIVYLCLSSSNFGDTSKETITKKRLLALFLMPVSMGLLMREGLIKIYTMKPELVITAIMTTIVTFGFVTFWALFLSSRMMLILGVLLCNLMWYIIMVIFGDLFFKSEFVNKCVMLMTILLYVGSTVYHTQMTLWEFGNGKEDFILHAIKLYEDMLNLFLEILRVLVMIKEKKFEGQKSGK